MRYLNTVLDYYYYYFFFFFCAHTVYFISLVSLLLGSSILVSTTPRKQSNMSNGNSKDYHRSIQCLLLVQLALGEAYKKCLMVLWLSLQCHSSFYFFQPHICISINASSFNLPDRFHICTYNFFIKGLM